MLRTHSIILMLCMLMASASAFSQLPDGSVAPNFTATDLNGQTWDLYEVLAEGKTVVLDFFATWCNPCWSYHNSGILSDLYENYGPEGTGQLEVFMIESSSSSSLEDIYGLGNNTNGDWTEGTEFPIFDDGNDIFADFDNSFFPLSLIHI